MKKHNPRSQNYTISLPGVLNEMVLEKMRVVGYSSVGEVCREQLRKWVNE